MNYIFYFILILVFYICRPALQSTQPPTEWVLGLSREGGVGGVKWLGCGFGHSPLTRAKVKERVELHLYSTYESLCLALG